MNTRVLNGKIAFSLDNVNELLAAKQLGMFVCDLNENYFNYDVEEKDGRYREATEEEKTDRAIDAMREGYVVCAVMCAPSGYKLVERSATTLQCNFYPGQHVYMMYNNKIVSVEILRIWLTRGDIEYKNDSMDIAENLYNEVKSFGKSEPGAWGVLSKREKNYLSEKIDVTKARCNNFARVQLDDKKSVGLMVNLDELFATKEELINHLMEE